MNEESLGRDMPTALPESIPQVSFDINLGKRFRYLDFDYQAYDEHLQTQDIRPDQIQALSIHFKPLTSLLGEYSSRTGTIQVPIPKRSAESSANQLLAHETQHFIDFTTGHVSELDEALTAASSIWFKAGISAMLAGTALQAYGIAQETLQYKYNSLGIAVGGMILATVGAVYYGRISRLENRARNAQKGPPHIVTAVT